ncbi:MAG: (2Fe-2S)-binding protein [Alkaliphilus sp.]
MSKSTTICRCSDISKEEIRELISQGYTTLEEIKRISRAGMGPCQGRTCGQLILREISSITGKKMGELENFNNRPPAIGIKISDIVKGAEEDEKNC